MRFTPGLLASSLLALTLSGAARATVLDFDLTLFLNGSDVTGTNTIAGSFTADTADATPLGGGVALAFGQEDFQDVVLTSGVTGQFVWSNDPIAALRYRPAINRVDSFDLTGEFADLPPGTPLPGFPFTSTFLQGNLTSGSAGPGPNDTTLVGLDSFTQVINFTTGAEDRITSAVITVTSVAPEPGETPDDPVLPDPGPSSCAPPPWCMPFSSLLVKAGGLGDASPIYIDPPVAIGYEYEILVPGVFFGSVLIPPGSGFVDGDMLELLVSGFPTFELLVGIPFDFVDEGLLDVDVFSIEGIDPELGLAIDDPLAFVTGLTFVGPGGARLLGASTEVQVTMTAIRQDIGVPVPEPGSLALLAMGALGFGFARRRSH